jgi:hypothetical protein
MFLPAFTADQEHLENKHLIENFSQFQFYLPMSIFLSIFH